MLWRKYARSINDYKLNIALFSVMFWVCCLVFNIHIGMHDREYPFGIISIIEAICASYVIYVKYLSVILK